MKIEVGINYLTRSENLVRIYATDQSGDAAVHGAIASNGEWIPSTWCSNGMYFLVGTSPNDIVSRADNPVEKKDKPKLKAWRSKTNDLLFLSENSEHEFMCERVPHLDEP